MLNQQVSIDSTRENLNNLCRKYPSEELAKLGATLTELIKKYQAVQQLSNKALASLQNSLQLHFSGEAMPETAYYSYSVLHMFCFSLG